jgi:hypothetical protein
MACAYKSHWEDYTHQDMVVCLTSRIEKWPSISAQEKQIESVLLCSSMILDYEGMISNERPSRLIN